MKNTIHALSFENDQLSFIADRLIEETGKKNDFSEFTVIFPGKRPGFYLRQLLADKIHGSFFPPRIFSVSEFMSYIAEKRLKGFKQIDPLNGACILFECLQDVDEPAFKYITQDFGKFIFWGLELYKTIDKLDKALIDNKKLASIKTAAPDIPDRISAFINNLSGIRTGFHNRLQKNMLTTEGYNYLAASEYIEQEALEGGRIYFMGLIAVTNAEANVIKKLLSTDRAYFYTQIESADDDVIKRLAETLDAVVEPANPHKLIVQPILYQAFDAHSEVSAVSRILSSEDIINDKHATPSSDEVAVVLPDPGTLLPLLSHVMNYIDADYNVTMGYPLKRTPLYTLIDQLLRTQLSRKDDGNYHAVDYIRIMSHPYIKGLFDAGTRIMVHKIEEKLAAAHRTFIDLGDLENSAGLFKDLFVQIAAMIRAIEGSDISIDTLKKRLKRIHQLFFEPIEPEKITINRFAQYLYDIIVQIVENSSANEYILSPVYVEYMIQLTDRLKAVNFNEQLNKEHIFDFFRYYAESQSVPFKGTPLKGIQILGLLETRVLKFKKVIILDCNETVVPAGTRYESILPLNIMRHLGLSTYKDHDAIFRYHIRRLLGGAKKSFLIYQKTDEMIRSRFIEELIWDMEKASGKLFDKDEIKQCLFSIKIKGAEHLQVKKDERILNKLKDICTKGLSPTAIDLYMKCPIQFYYSYILGLEGIEDIEQKMEAKDIGTIVHAILNRFYAPYRKKIFHTFIPEEKKRLEMLIESALTEHYHYTNAGEVFLTKQIIKASLDDFVLADAEKQPFIIDLETNFYAPISADIRLRGKIDRIDKRKGQIIIVDYKTGTAPLTSRLLKLSGQLKERKEMKKLIVSFQLPVYLYLYHKNSGTDYDNLNACFYTVKDKKETLLFNDKKYANQHAELTEKILMPSMENLIKEILDPETPFVCDDSDEKACGYCPFSTMCCSLTEADEA